MATIQPPELFALLSFVHLLSAISFPPDDLAGIVSLGNFVKALFICHILTYSRSCTEAVL